MHIIKTIVAIISTLTLCVFSVANSEDRTADDSGNPVTSSTIPVFCEAWSSDDGYVLKKFYKDITLAELVMCLEAGADPNYVSEYGFTPLHRAAQTNENPKIIVTLVEAGADPSARNDNGFTPLHGAASSNENPAIIEALVEAGADPGARNDYGVTPLHVAAYSNENPAIIVAFVEVGADLSVRNDIGATPLHVAASFNENPAIIEALVEAGADLSARDEDGATPLHDAVSTNENPAIMVALVEAGADLNSVTNKGFTPLDFAKMEGKPQEIIELLGGPKRIIASPQNLGSQVPVTTQKPGSVAEQVVNAIAGELNTWFGSREQQLALSGPIHSGQQDNDTVVVYFPGTEVIWDNGVHSLKLGDLALTVTRLDETKYAFDTVLPRYIGLFWRGKRQLTVLAEGEIYGIWRSDLETFTALDFGASEIEAIGEWQDLFGIDSLIASSRLERTSDGLWNGDSTIHLSDLQFTLDLPLPPDIDYRMGLLNVTTSIEDADLDSLLMTTQPEVIAGENDEIEVLQQIPEFFLHNQLGLIEVEISYHDLNLLLTYRSDEAKLGYDELSLKAMIDDREELTDISIALNVIEPQFEHSQINHLGILPVIVPEAVKMDIALNRYPIRRIAEMVQGLATPDYESGDGQKSLQNSVIMALATAGSLLDVREVRIVAPNYEILMEGEFQADPKSAFGVTGRMDTRIQGFENYLKWAAERGEMKMSSVILLLRGLGKPTLYSSNDNPTYLYELDILSDGSVTLNDIPLDSLLKELTL